MTSGDSGSPCHIVVRAFPTEWGSRKLGPAPNGTRHAVSTISHQGNSVGPADPVTAPSVIACKDVGFPVVIAAFHREPQNLALQ